MKCPYIITISHTNGFMLIDDMNMKIELDDLSRGLYMVHLDKKNYRICNAIRTLILRSNFSELLSKLESDVAIQEKMIIKPAPKVDP